jgi:hypothetical protein
VMYWPASVEPHSTTTTDPPDASTFDLHNASLDEPLVPTYIFHVWLCSGQQSLRPTSSIRSI